ncbi:helix-hairpin-helix domain-containing protein [Aetokthonos hydrillicola Thurmond2011]|jgi:hypothetical protein|uniref:Helix-hairpin-helix domain-containing protein n=1 Tax=Aetokthonos hydrillicola Thurmond2011 TaxID=2712845 RepID=A0AAP5IDQ9_9CYAN|nr:helix-hairpin-helix domain-containing protein [Aetokthonos hydrillicola]MBW4584313.1 helix-hairpin-helix domain-containing protein [Aetokthonos hydrillicola CCALA 1050]MDR9898479.1 helix-hairpin-helix domain-containing protein [Aetokthonos hydrillicola Thurmond2011]
MFKIRPIYYVITLVSFMFFVACGSPSTNTSNTQPTAVTSPAVNTADHGSQAHGEAKFNINTSLEPELEPIAAKIKVDELYDKINKARPYKSLDELVSKNVLTQAQFDQVKNMLTLDSTVSGEAKDVDYLVKLGLMKGHLLVAKELLDIKRPAEALPHVGHPIEELYVTVADQFPQRGVADFKDKMDEAKDFIKNKPEDPKVMPKFQAGMAALDKAIAALPETQRRSPKFVAQVINGLLDSASAEYGGSISGNKIEEVDYQDSRGFVAYAYTLYKDAQPQLQKDNSKLDAQLKTGLEDLRKAWPTVLPPSKLVSTGDEVTTKVKKIAQITKPLTGTENAPQISNATTSTKTSTQGLSKFKGFVTASLTAAKANNLTEAKKEMASAAEAWEQVEDGVKANSKDAYKTIESGISDVQTSLVIPPNPDQAKSVKALESLLKAVDSYKAQ